MEVEIHHLCTIIHNKDQAIKEIIDHFNWMNPQLGKKLGNTAPLSHCCECTASFLPQSD